MDGDPNRCKLIDAILPWQVVGGDSTRVSRGNSPQNPRLRGSGSLIPSIGSRDIPAHSSLPVAARVASNASDQGIRARSAGLNGAGFDPGP